MQDDELKLEEQLIKTIERLRKLEDLQNKFAPFTEELEERTTDPPNLGWYLTSAAELDQGKSYEDVSSLTPGHHEERGGNVCVP